MHKILGVPTWSNAQATQATNTHSTAVLSIMPSFALPPPFPPLTSYSGMISCVHNDRFHYSFFAGSWPTSRFGSVAAT